MPSQDYVHLTMLFGNIIILPLKNLRIKNKGILSSEQHCMHCYVVLSNICDANTFKRSFVCSINVCKFYHCMITL